jgi:uncharacterized protein (DUF305 family)
MMRKLVLGVLLSLVVLPLAVSVQADALIDGRAGRAELRFLEGMIDHHQMAIDMANDCLMKAESADLRTLCQQIIDAQSAEITEMQGWLLAWYNVDYQPVSMTAMGEGDGMEGMDHSDHQMDGMPYTDPAMMMGMMAGLNRLEGRDYDSAWTESMIDHHDDALHMAERLLTRLGDDGHEPLKALAEKIIADQTAEIEYMESLLTQWSA